MPIYRISAAVFLLIAGCSSEKKSNGPPSFLECPSLVSDTSTLNPEILKLGRLTQTDKILYHVGLNWGRPATSDTLEPDFDDEHVDEWESTPDGEMAIWEYERGRHNGMELRCDYFPKDKYSGLGEGYEKSDGPITLLIPIPDSANFNCKFVRNPSKYKFSAACDLTYTIPPKTK